MSGELGKASLELDADLARFKANIAEGRKTAGGMEDALEAIVAIGRAAEVQLGQVKLDAAQGVRSNEIADRIERSVGGVGRAAMEASEHLSKVKLDARQAAESDAAGDVIDRKLKDITGNANEARRSLESVRIAGFASGYGRIGLLGTAIGAGTLLAPAAGPGALGLLAGIPALAAAGGGALGTLILAFQGVGKAIGGDLKAFQGLQNSQQQFVLTVRSLTGELHKLQEVAASSLFPGLTAGLRAALSPGTLGAVTQAIEAFGNAIGHAGEQWGRYFGSAEFQSIFLPLMQAGAHELTLMSGAALALFDAFGVLGRAASPLVTWLAEMAERGSQLLDSWLHAKDASGQLTGAMNEAQRSLTLVWNLAVALGRALEALGAALYPVSQIAVKDLTDGLNGLAGIISRNQTVIREIVGGALAALVGAVKVAVDGFRLFIDVLEHIVGDKATIVAAMTAIGIAMVFALGPGSQAVIGVALAVGLIEQHWQQLGTFFGQLGDWIVDKFRWVAQHIGDMLAAIPHWLAPGLHDAGVSLQQWAADTGANMGDSMGQQMNQHLQKALYQGALTMKDLTSSGFNTDLLTGGSLRQIGGVNFTGKDLVGTKTSLLSAIAQAVADVGGNQVKSINITSAKRAPGPGNDVQNSNHITGDAVDGYVVLKNGTSIPLGTYLKAVAGAYGLRSGDVAGFDPKTKGGFDPVHVDDGANVGGAGGLGSPFGNVPPFSKNVPAPKQPKGPITGDKLFPSAIADQIARFANIASNTAGKVAEKALDNERDELLKARDIVTAKLKGSTGAQRDAIKSELTDLNAKLGDVNKAIKDNIAAQKKAVADAIAAVKSRFSSPISTLTSAVSTMFQRIQSDLDAALQAKFQQQVSALGDQFLQNGQLTASESALVAMQAQDQRDQVYATGDPRQIAEYELGLKAQQERDQANKEYAVQLADLQQKQRLEQEKLDDSLAAFGAQVADGTANIGALTAIVQPFGISISDVPADQLAYDMGGLSDATQALSQVMLAEAVALAKLGDSKDARAAAATAQALLDNDDPFQVGIAAALAAPHDASDVISRLLGRTLPSLDIGGEVLETGVARVHRGEVFSGVGKGLGGDMHFHGGTWIGGNKRQVAKDLAPYLDTITKT